MIKIYLSLFSPLSYYICFPKVFSLISYLTCHPSLSTFWWKCLVLKRNTKISVKCYIPRIVSLMAGKWTEICWVLYCNFISIWAVKCQKQGCKYLRWFIHSYIHLTNILEHLLCTIHWDRHCVVCREQWRWSGLIKKINKT